MHLEEALGGYGQTVRVEPNLSEYPINTIVEGKAASEIQLVVWAPGCETRTYSLNLQIGSFRRRLTYEWVTLPPIALTGRIRSFNTFAGKPLELAIFFFASWECQFFGWYDCLVPQMFVATLTPNADGTFRAQVPDFESDPVITKVKSLLQGSGDFLLLLPDPKTLNPFAELQPEIEDFRAPGGTLKTLPTYPSDLVFIAKFADR